MAAQPMHYSSLSVLLLAAVARPSAAAEPPPFEPQFRHFAEKHCVSCHGPKVQRRKLRLDNLPATFADKETAATWTKVLDRLAHGEMPPKDEPRPAQQEIQAVLAGLQRQLHNASLVKQQSEGRVVLRRLNRTEYATTLGDLLGTAVDVKDLLPEDNSAAGFDNVERRAGSIVGALAPLSGSCGTALRAVIPTKPLAEFKERRTGRQVTEKMIHFKDMLGKSAKLDGDVLILYARPYSHIPCATAPAPQTGRYRVRASVYAVGTDGKSLPVRCVCDDVFGRDESDVRAVRDVPMDKATLIEGEFQLKQRQAMVFVGWSLPTLREFGQKALGQFTGPGVAVEWVEIEGPIDPWPPVGYERLFAGVPLKPQSVARAKPRAGRCRRNPPSAPGFLHLRSAGGGACQAA